MAAIFVRLAEPAPPVVVGFYRMAFAGIALGLGLALTRTPIRLRGREGALGLAAGACFGADLAMWQTSVTLTSVATATLLVNVTPVHVGLYTRFVLGERLARRFVAGAALALLGTAILLGGPETAPTDLRGAALALFASLFYAAYLLTLSEARRSLDVMSGLVAVTAGAAGVLGAVAWLRGDPFTGFAPGAWAAMLGAAAISQGLGVLGIVWALRFLPPTLASVALLGQPVGAAALAWWILGEPLSSLQAAGGVAVLVGIALASAAQRPATT